MTNLANSQDVIQDALVTAGEPKDGTSDYQDDAVSLLNSAYRAIWNGGTELAADVNETWWWLKKDPPGTLKLELPIEAGSVAFTLDSAAGTFSSAPAASLAGWHIKADDEPEVYRIITHTGGAAAFTMDSAFVGATNATAAYRAFKLEYDLASDVLGLYAPMRGYGHNRLQVRYIDEGRMDEDYPIAGVEQGAPDFFTFVGERKVRFNRYPQEIERLEYPYLIFPADLEDSASSVPLIPKQYMHLLMEYLAFKLLDLKDDNKAATHALIATNGVKAMAKENRHKALLQGGGELGRIFPRANSRPRQPLRTESGNIIG